MLRKIVDGNFVLDIKKIETSWLLCLFLKMLSLHLEYESLSKAQVSGQTVLGFELSTSTSIVSHWWSTKL